MPLPSLGGFVTGLGGLANMLGLGFQGYAQDQATRTLNERNRQRDLSDAQEHAAMMANYQSQVDTRKAAADREQLERDALSTYGEAAAAGDTGAQAKITAVFGSRAPGIMKEYRDLGKTPAKRTQYDADRGGLVNLDDGSFTPIPGLPAGRPHPLALGEPGYIPALTEELKVRQQYPTASRTASGESPAILATRKDIQGNNQGQIRTEHDIATARSDMRNLISETMGKAALPLSSPKIRTAADSAAVNQYADLATARKVAEARKAQLTASGDSMRNVISRLRAGDPTADIPPLTPPASPVLSGAAIQQRAQLENAGFMESVAKIKQNIKDPALQAQRIQAASQLFNSRLQKINLGIDPDQE